MTYDFAFFLLVGTVITGVIWLLDSLLWAPKRKNNPYEYSSESMPGASVSSKEPVVVEYAKSFFPVLLIVFLLFQRSVRTLSGITKFLKKYDLEKDISRLQIAV